MIPSFEDYQNYCSNTGSKPGRFLVLRDFVRRVEDGTLVKCDCCGDYIPEVNTFTARYDFDKLVCEDCHEDGN